MKNKTKNMTVADFKRIYNGTWWLHPVCPSCKSILSDPLKLFTDCYVNLGIRGNPKLMKACQDYMEVEQRLWGLIDKIKFEFIDPLDSDRMYNLGSRNYALISRGVKTAGTYDPEKIFSYFEEELYINEAKEIWNFLKWVHENNKHFGSQNYEQVFHEFCISNTEYSAPKEKTNKQ